MDKVRDFVVLAASLLWKGGKGGDLNCVCEKVKMPVITFAFTITDHCP